MIANTSDPHIQERLKLHLDCCLDHYPENEWVGIFLVGSQNYGLATETSDVDSKIIILPTLEDIALNREPISKTLKLPDGEQTEVKDIRLMFKCYRKQNINFIETLFTPYHALNKRWIDLFTPMLKANEKIARYNRKQAIDTMCGMVLERFKKFQKSLGNGANDYDGKNACTILRVAEFLERYINGEPYAQCLISNIPDALLKYKTCSLHQDTVVQDVIRAETRARAAHMYFDTFDTVPDREAEEIMDQVLISIFRRLLSESQ